MSASELHTYTWYKAHNAAKMPPRLRIKEHLTEVFAHVLGHDKRAQASVLRFCSACATKGQAFAVLYVHGVRLDLSNQTIFLDAALSCKEANDSTNTVVHTTTITNEEMVFWKHIFCAAAERCRTWKHKDSCEYIAAGKIPVSCEGDSNYLCSCGLGVFPKNYLAHPHSSTTTKKNAVRIALPLIFASPISPVTAGEDVYDLVAPPPTPRLQEIRPTATELPSAAESVHQAPKCFSCERETNRDGKQLRRCTRCGVARYCSRECQRSDWKAHKDLCMGLADATGDDHVAQ